MSHRYRKLALVRFTLIKGLELGRHSFLLVFPLSLTLSAIEFGLRPKAQPTFMDATDWAIVFFFMLGLLAFSAVHAGIVLQMNAARKGQALGTALALSQGIERGVRMLAAGLIYSMLILIGLLVPTALLGLIFFIAPEFQLGAATYFYMIVFTIVPVIYLATIFYFTFFLAAFQDYSPDLPWYIKIKNYFSESFQIVRGHWWLTFGVLAIIVVALFALEQLCFLLLRHHLVLATIFCVLARAIFLPFWYGWSLVLLFELKKSHFECGFGHRK